jgi:hypothetical protein
MTGEKKMKKSELNFENDLSIDKYKLDEECVTHSALYYRYSELAANAKNQVGVLSDNLKLIMSEVNIKIRNRFIKEETKFTEAVINAEVEKEKTVLEAREELRQAELNLARLQAGVSAFEHRKSQLDNLVKLYCAGYFSTPANSGKQRETVNEQASRDVRAGLNKAGKKKPSVDDEEEDD